ncbi:MAG: hypothetical protein IPL60_14795 [Ardenticatenia bacterium]|mgnify:CR=1 FL=1|nr:hypothetical protein [Ardenticatenia bacterium]
MKTETAFAIVAVLIAALTFRKANIDLPVTAQNAGGGSNAGSAPPPTPLSMVGDPIESESGFDDITATGSDLVGETPVQVAELVGCVSPQGGSPYGRFLVTIGDPAVASSPSYCADYGDTVSDGGVSVVFGTQAADTIDGTHIPADHHALVFGLDGNDVIIPPNGDYDLYLLAGAGDDDLRAPISNGDYGQFVFGGVGSDILVGSAGPDVIVGGVGDDSLTDGAGLDELQGGAGADDLNFCPNDGEWDDIRGGDGIDRFHAFFLVGFRQDTVHDYETGEVNLDCDGNEVH